MSCTRDDANTTVRLACAFSAAVLTLLAAFPMTVAADNNDRYQQEIETLRGVHIPALATGILAPPPTDKLSEVIEYGTNITLKFVPPVLKTPQAVVVRPNNGACEFRYRDFEHSLEPVFDYEDIFGFTLGLPSDWGRLDDGDQVLSNSTQSEIEIFHYNTGAYVTIRRALFDHVDDPDPWYPAQQRRVFSGEEILFTDTNERNDIINGSFTADAMEIFPIGVTPLMWEAETKLDFIFDIVLDPIIFFAELKHTAKATAKTTRQAQFTRVWSEAATEFAQSLAPALRDAVFDKAIQQMRSLGFDAIADSLADASGQALGNIPTGSINRMTQNFIVLDEVPPVVRMTRQPEPFEANTLGGEFGARHFDELRELLEVSDECDRPVHLNSEPTGTRFWPVNTTTSLTWCGQDPGPNANGTFNETCADIEVQVVDTRPPLLLPPASVNVVSTDTSNSLNIGWAGVFDVADPEVRVTNNAPMTFPVGRTPVTWTARDGSGNSTSGTQWVNVKPNNTPPTAFPKGGLGAISFEETRINLDADDLDLLDGRHDQLSFRIDDVPDNGFFVAPLFPFFIDDHRQHRINPDGTYTSFFDEARLDCADPGQEPDVTTILEPVYVTVTDDDIMYVMDSALECQRVGTPDITRHFRIARFTPNESGELDYANHYEVGTQQPGDRERHLFIDHLDQLWFVPPGGERIVTLSSDLQEVGRIEFRQLTQINPSTGSVVSAFPNASSAVQSVVVDRNGILYATDGSQMFAYDLSRFEANDSRDDHFLRLYSVAYRPGNEVDTSVEEPWASYESFLGGGYADLALDSIGNIYVSDPVVDRLWKFQATHLSDDRNTIEQAPELIGWLGKCTENLDPTILACDTSIEQSIGFSCQDDLCGTAGTTTAGNLRGQFNEMSGIAMSPQDVVYVTDTGNNRVQRFTTDGFFAGEAVSTCGGSCFVLGDFGFVTNVAVNSNFFYLLDTDEDLTHIFETTPITDIDDQTMSQTQTAFVKYKSEDNYRGPDSFTFTAFDGLEFSNEARVDIVVSRNFRAPFATPGLMFDGIEDQDTPLVFSGLDRDGDQLDFEIGTPPQNGTILRSGDQFTYTPNSNFNGLDTFTYTATDALTSVPAQRSEPELVTVNVAAVNDPPTFSAEPLDEAGVGFEVRIEALLEDLDPNDNHRVAIDWGNGIIFNSDSNQLTTGSSPGKVRVVASSRYFETGNYVITLCASDTPAASALTCLSPDVNAVMQLPITVAEQVDLRIEIADSLPKTSDPDVPAIEISGPLLDGGDVITYMLRVINRSTNTDFVHPIATNAELVITVPDEMDLLTAGTDTGTCSFADHVATCLLGDMVEAAEALVTVEAVGRGLLTADEIVTLQAEARSDQRSTSAVNAGSLQTTLLLNGTLDPDGDGFSNANDAFPGDSTEWLDTDTDGIGNNADIDDDNDSLPDRWEGRYGFDPLDPSDAGLDNDLDMLSNADEFSLGTRPDTDDSDLDQTGDENDNCPVNANRNQFDFDLDGVGDACDPDTFAAAVQLGNIDSGGGPDYALLRTDGGRYTAFIKDSSNNLSVGADRIDLGAVVDHSIISAINSQGDLAVLLQTASQTLLRVFDTISGDMVIEASVISADSRPLAILAAGDEIWAVAEDSTEVRRILAGDGSILQGVVFDDTLTPVGLARPDSTSVLLLGIDGATGDVIVEIRALADGTLIESTAIGGPDVLKAIVSSTENGFAVMTQSANGTSNVSTMTSDATAVSMFEVFETGWTVLEFETLPAWSGSGDALTVTAVSLAGDIQTRVIDAANGSELTVRDFAAQADALRGATVAASGTTSDVGVLIADINNAISLEIQSAEGANANSIVLTAESIAPPPPPPPVPPPSSGGGGSIGYPVLLFVGLLLIHHRRRKTEER